MQIKSILWLTRIFSVISLGLIVFLVLFQAPYIKENYQDRSYLSVSAFVIGIFMFMASLATLIIFRIRKNLFEQDLWHATYAIALRQGILISLGAVVLLVLQAFRVLTWWDGLLAIGAIFMIELYFLVR